MRFPQMNIKPPNLTFHDCHFSPEAFNTFELRITFDFFHIFSHNVRMHKSAVAKVIELSTTEFHWNTSSDTDRFAPRE